MQKSTKNLIVNLAVLIPVLLVIYLPWIKSDFGNQKYDTTIQPSYESLISKGLESYYSKDYNAALSSFLVASEINPDRAMVFNNIACCYCQLGEWKLAVLACKKALSIDPEMKLALANLNWAESELN